MGFRVMLSEGEKMMYATGLAYAGQLGGIAGADEKCMTDYALPTGNGTEPTFKAFIVSATRFPCSVANCGDGSTSSDWVLTPNTDYVNRRGEPIFTSTAEATVPVPLATGLTAGNTNFWGGFTDNDDWLVDPTNTCNDWEATSTDFNGRVGWTGTGGDFRNGGSVPCNSTWPVLCVEQ